MFVSLTILDGGGYPFFNKFKKEGKMKKLIVLLSLVIVLFGSCSSDTPKPEKNDTPPASVSNESMTNKTSTGKFVVETTIQGLTAQVMNALHSGKAVSLENVTLQNGVLIQKGSVSFVNEVQRRASTGASKYKLAINIEEATTNNKPVTLVYEGDVEIDGDKITKIETVKADAKINDVSVPDISSETFVPVALTFYNTDLLGKLAEIMKDISEQLSEDLGVSLEEITLDVQGVRITVDCQKSALVSTGDGVLVFKLDLDNQWHTMSSVAGQITIDGWAEVTETGIEASNEPLVTEGETDKDTDNYIANEFAPRFYGLYQLAGIIMQDYRSTDANMKATDEQLREISEAASKLYNQDMAVRSFEVNFDYSESASGLYNVPYEITVKATMSEFNNVEMVVKIYRDTNNPADAQIVKMIIDGKDYSYLSLDMLKSMFRVFGAEMYFNSLMGTAFENIPEGYQGGIIDVNLGWNPEEPANYEYKFNGKATLSFTGNEISIEFNNVTVSDSTGLSPEEEPIRYIISGSGYASQNPMVYEVRNFSLRGVGTSTSSDLHVANIFMNEMINAEK